MVTDCRYGTLALYYEFGVKKRFLHSGCLAVGHLLLGGRDDICGTVSLQLAQDLLHLSSENA